MTISELVTEDFIENYDYLKIYPIKELLNIPPRHIERFTEPRKSLEEFLFMGIDGGGFSIILDRCGSKFYKIIDEGEGIREEWSIECLYENFDTFCKIPDRGGCFYVGVHP